MNPDSIWFLAYKHKPQGGPGWYPILWTYSPAEGIFPDGAYWNGDQWFWNSATPPPVIAFIPTRFPNRDEAAEFAYRFEDENDSEGLA